MKPLPAFGVALAAVAAFTAAGLTLQLIVPTSPIAFLLFVPPILATAMVGGLGPTLFATVLGGVSAEFFFRRPYLQFADDVGELYPLSLYLTIGVGIAVLAGHLARARQHVQRREREFETLFSLTPIGIGIANDPLCKHISMNLALAELLRLQPHENASLSAPEGQRPRFTVMRDGIVVAPADLPLQRAARLGHQVRDAELDVVQEDGSTITLYEYAAPLFDDAGKVRGAIGAFLNITERKQAEDSLRRLVAENQRLYREAQEANLLKDEFLATLSHELRTPLNALLGWIHLLKSGHLAADKQQRALDALDRNAKLQAQLTSDLLDVSGAITGKLRIQPESVLLEPLVEDVIESLRPAAESKGLDLRASVSMREAVVVDSSRLQQILWNLLSNAIKFTPRDGRIQTDVARVAGELVIVVSDTGAGIPASFLPHVFERFRQADSGTTRAHGGLGLGLSIVKQLTELHGGSVQAENPGEGLGATFTVRLPARAS